MKYRCLYRTASTSFTTGKKELPPNCIARGCRGEFDRIKEMLVCFTAESGNPIGIMRWRKDRERALSRRGIPKATYIDSQANMIKMGSQLLGGICEFPEQIPAVAKLEEAICLIRSEKPDIVIIDWYGRIGRDERVELLEAIKNLDPKIKVILYSDNYYEQECERLMVSFDGVIYKGWDDPLKLKEVVSGLVTENLAPMKSQEKARKKLLIIEDNEESLNTISLLMGDICDVPDKIPTTNSLEQAKALIEQYSPDIVISDKQFDISNGNAYHELLDFIKWRDPNTKVILWSCNVGTEDNSSAKHSYDSVFFKTEYAGLILAVKKLNE